MGSRILVVDDSAFMRRAITDVLERLGHEVVGRARNGREGVDLAAKLKPDIVTLDIEMPEMDGLTALPRILSQCEAHVIMVSSLTAAGSREALRALNAGASDVVAKSHSQFAVDVDSLGEELGRKVAALGSKRRQPSGVRSTKSASTSICPTLSSRLAGCDLIAVGSSTGGPPALEKMLAQLSSNFTPSILIAQHMPAAFTASLAERLHEMCELRVVHAEHRMPVRPGFVYVAPGGKQMRVRRAAAGYRIEVGTEPAGELYKPCVNVLFESVATAAGANAAAVVLTGMGDDGAKGARLMHDAGSVVLAQCFESCVVYGMPRAVSEAGVADASMTPEEIGQCLSKHIRAARQAG